LEVTVTFAPRLPGTLRINRRRYAMASSQWMTFKRYFITNYSLVWGLILAGRRRAKDRWRRKRQGMINYTRLVGRSWQFLRRI
jgi:hypothetical protein